MQVDGWDSSLFTGDINFNDLDLILRGNAIFGINNNLNTRVFYCNNGDFQIWKKPPGAQLIHIICNILALGGFLQI